MCAHFETGLTETATSLSAALSLKLSELRQVRSNLALVVSLLQNHQLDCGSFSTDLA